MIGRLDMKFKGGT